MTTVESRPAGILYDLSDLQEASTAFVGCRYYVPGTSYKRIHLPLSGLFTKDGRPKIIACTPSEEPFIVDLTESEGQKRITELTAKGVYRSAYDEGVSVGASSDGGLILGEYRPAELRRRQLRPVGSERFFKLIVTAPTTPAPTASRELYESFIYTIDGAQTGQLLDYDANPALQDKLGSIVSEADVLLRARDWLRRTNPGPHIEGA